MRCRTCGETAHPGYVIWRGAAAGPGLFPGAPVPCPECGGSGIVSACEGRPFEHAGSRQYRAYYLDECGMIVLAEAVGAACDEAAIEAAEEHLAATGGALSLEVWDGSRCVRAQRRDPMRLRSPRKDGFAERLW